MRLAEVPPPSEIGESSSDRLTLLTYSQDLWPRKLLELRESGPPSEPTIDLVAWPENREQVQALLVWARRANAIVLPYGAGSGVCGATIPAPGEARLRVIADLKKMRAVRSIDRKSQTAWVESGIIGENLERHLNQEGFTLGHFPSSIYCSTLGGYLATRSAGQLSTKYGKIEDLVLSLECVLADGTCLTTGRAPRSAMGPDWTQLLLGSEGTLAFFTAACVQIQRSPRARIPLSFAARNVSEALAFARELMQRDLRPAVLRIYDPLETSLTVKKELLGSSSPSGAAAVVLWFEGGAKVARAESEEATELARELGVESCGPALAEHWWENRYHVSYKQQLILSHGRTLLDTFEVAATWDRIEEVYRSVRSADKGLGLILAHFSHFYVTGANIYFTLVGHSGTRSPVERYDEVWESMLDAAAAAGATLSHHHGAGLQKNAWFRQERGAFVDIFRKVKGAFDPENRLNPGKMGL